MLTTKAKMLVMSVLLGVASSVSPKGSTILLESKKGKLSDDLPELEREKWVQFVAIVLTQTNKNKILMGEKLNDRHIDVAQGFLKQQFPGISRLQSPLLQKKKQPKADCQQQIQIIHSRSNHWIVASTVLVEDGQVKVYDSIYCTLDRETVSFQTFSMNQPGKTNP